MLPHSTPNRSFDDVNKPCDGTNRRDFLRVIGLGAAATLSPAFSMAADSTGAAVPSDPKFSPAWGDSLLSRGAPTVYRGNDLATIGMPVGGLCAGQLYLGGDGKLWHWGIFNRHIDSGCGGPALRTADEAHLAIGARVWLPRARRRARPSFAPWIGRASPPSPSEATIRSATLNTAIRQCRSPSRSTPSHRSFR